MLKNFYQPTYIYYDKWSWFVNSSLRMGASIGHSKFSPLKGRGHFDLLNQLMTQIFKQRCICRERGWKIDWFLYMGKFGSWTISLTPLFTAKRLHESLVFWYRTLLLLAILLLVSGTSLLAAKRLESLKTVAGFLGMDIRLFQAIASAFIRLTLSVGKNWRWCVDFSTCLVFLRTGGLGWCLFWGSMVNSDWASFVLCSIKRQEFFIIIPGRKIDITKSISIRFLLGTHSDLRKIDTFWLHETLHVRDVRLMRELSNETHVNACFVTLTLWTTLFE